jgi:hypothetical protein
MAARDGKRARILGLKRAGDPPIGFKVHPSDGPVAMNDAVNSMPRNIRRTRQPRRRPPVEVARAVHRGMRALAGESPAFEAIADCHAA